MVPRCFSYAPSSPADPRLLAQLPPELQELLLETNGFVTFAGGLHVRGACAHPEWHSIEAVWHGQHALSTLYPGIEPGDVPFAQDIMGDQFLLRPLASGRIVIKLLAETGEVEGVATSLEEFFRLARADPLIYLSLAPVVQLQEEGRTLEPGQILVAYPPYCTEEAEDGVSLRAVPALRGLHFLSRLAARLHGARDGDPLTLKGLEL